MPLRKKKKTSKKVAPASTPGHYFPFTEDKIERIGSGCLLLDDALGGGWAQDKIFNIVGDSSTGKTLLAIEACANFVLKHKDKAQILYFEGEAAFDEDYAASLGLPSESVTLIRDLDTIEEISEYVNKEINTNVKAKNGNKLFVIIDSVDSFSTSLEVSRDKDDKGSYGTEKALALSQFFRKITRKLSRASVTMCVVSQTRQRIGVFFGKAETRSGGKALDFYATQILWLTEIGKIKRTVDKIDAIIGIRVKARVEKNKAGPPFKEALISIMFNFGVDDLLTSLDYLKKVGKLKAAGWKDNYTSTVNALRVKEGGQKEYNRLRRQAGKKAVQLCNDRTKKLQPKFSKYE